MRELFARLRDWLRRDELDDELADELRFHKEALARDARAAGTDAADATWEARRRLGNVTRVVEESRDRWSLPWLDHLQQDVRYALRGLRRAPGFAITVVLTLGLGIGANAAMFGVIDRLMLRPDPYMRDPATAHRIYLQITSTTTGRLITSVSFPYTRYLDLRKWTTSFSDAAAFVQARHAVGVGDATRIHKIAGVSAEYFGFFDMRPVRGRFFQPHEDTLPAGANVAIVSEGYWRSELGGGDVIGQPLQVGRVAYTIVGIAPEGFTGVSEGQEPTVWVPITAYAANEGGAGASRNYFTDYNWDWTEMLVRRKPGVSVEQANEDLTRAFARSRQAARAVHANFVQTERANPHGLLGALKTMGGPDPGLETRTLIWVGGVALIVLLIACANVANLFLARALRRRREVALRVALGVSRARLAAQSVTESLVLALLGCAAGVLTAQWGGAVIHRLLTPFGTFSLASDWRTLGVATLAAIAAGVLTGLAPVVFAGRTDLGASLKSGSREGTYQRSTLRTGLLVTQGALSVALLVGAGLFVRSLSRAGDVHLGYDVDPIVTVQLDMRGMLTPPERFALRARLLETARGLPGVEAASWTSNTPMQGTSTTGLVVPGIDSVARLGRFTFQMASPGYFDVMGTRIVRGRAITADDRVGTPLVTVVSEEMARTLWPGRDPIGECVRIGFYPAKPDTMPCTTVVGVAENVVNSYELDYPLRYYLPEEQLRLGVSQLIVRVRGRGVESAERVRRAIQSQMPGLSFAVAEPLSERIRRQQRSWRVGAALFAGFGLLALIVASVGLYGVIAYTVTQRMHELGVRMALGAQRSDVMRLVVGQGVRFAVAGVVIGSALALAASDWLQPLLFRQSARDPLVFTLVGVALVVVALLASAVPAFRAVRADPNSVLRSE
jgi:putative ABC transport system permease protein